MAKKGFLIIILLFLSGGVAFATAKNQMTSFEDLSSEEMLKNIISQRDLAIKKASERGDYRCCIEPDCTMCYMSANEWNGFEAGTCKCDDLIAEGKEPCPECKRGLCGESEETCTI